MWVGEPHSSQLLNEYLQGAGSGSWPQDYRNLELLSVQGEFSSRIEGFNALDNRALDLISTVSSQLLHDLETAGLVKVVEIHVIQGGYNIEFLSKCLTDPSATGWNDWIAVATESPPWGNVVSLLESYNDSGIVPKRSVDPILAVAQQCIRALEGDPSLGNGTPTQAADELIDQVLDQLFGIDAEAREDSDAYLSQLGLEQLISALNVPCTTDEAGQALLDYFLQRLPDEHHEPLPAFSTLLWDYEQASEYLFSLSSDITPVPWQNIAEDDQLAILQQLTIVSREHPSAWFPIALIARHPGSYESVLRAAAHTRMPAVSEALGFNSSAPDFVRAEARLLIQSDGYAVQI